jgi:hypothetical protein
VSPNWTIFVSDLPPPGESVRKYGMLETVDLLIQSIGFNPEMFGKRRERKLLELVCLIPYCERNQSTMNNTQHAEI